MQDIVEVVNLEGYLTIDYALSIDKSCKIYQQTTGLEIERSTRHSETECGVLLNYRSRQYQMLKEAVVLFMLKKKKGILP